MLSFYRTVGRLSIIGLITKNTKKATEDEISNLVRAGLLDPKRNQRYGQHSLLRAYAYALSEVAGDLNRIQARHFDHYTKRFGEFEASRDVQLRTLIKPEFRNVLETLYWGFENKLKDACLAVDDFNNMYTRFVESTETAINLLQAGVDACKKASFLVGIANLSTALGDLRRREGEYVDSVKHYDEALQAARKINHPLARVRPMKSLGDLYLMIGDLEQAEKQLEQVLSISLEFSLKDIAANTLRSFGQLRQQQGRIEDADSCFQMASDLYQQLRDSLGFANTQFSIAEMWLKNEVLNKAYPPYQKAIALYQQIGDFLGFINASIGLARLHRMQKQEDEACNYFRQVVEITRLRNFDKHPAIIQFTEEFIGICPSV